MALDISDKQIKILVAARKAIDEILEQKLEDKPLKPRSKKQRAFENFETMYGSLTKRKTKQHASN